MTRSSRFFIAVQASAIAAAAIPAGATAQGQQGAQNAAQRRGPKPYAEVITDKAQSDPGVFTVHKVEDKWFFEVPDSLLGRDMLLVSRIAGVPVGMGNSGVGGAAPAGLTSAGQSVHEYVVRWERHDDRLMVRELDFGAVAADSLPIAISVSANNVGPILGAFPIQALSEDSTRTVIDVTDFFGGDTPALAGLTAAQRRNFQVRRLDTGRSYIGGIHSYPLNVEVRHTQTFDAGTPPGDQNTATLSLEMNQSLVLLPKEPMRPRYADDRIGYFTVSRINYGLDELKAAQQTFIRRWRLEPKDASAYARGELVEPVKPITYYIDPATPLQWRKYMKQGVEDWQKAFETAGFKKAIVALDPPSPEEDPEWDPEDIRYSVVRWAASLVRNAMGPSTSDPRTGEIIESDIVWFHNHMRSYRNRLMVETGAANPMARSLEIPEELMGETMRQVIAHEIGHALGLPHNMIGSSSFPVDSLRSPSFTSRYGVSPSIMDYARQNYVAQPNDGLKAKDFIRRIGPYDHYVINWGYRVLPQSRTPEAERPTLNKWIQEKAGDARYHYQPQQFGGMDPRAQTEDVGDDPVKASGFAVANLKRVLPNLVQWTSTPGESYDDLAELYGEALGMWSTYMGHVTTLIGGVNVDLKSTEQAGAVYTPVPKAKQQAALAFIAANVIETPAWLAPKEIIDRIGPPPGNGSVGARQAGIVSQLLEARRLGRLQEIQAMDPAGAYPLAEYLGDVKTALYGAPAGGSPDANHRALQRTYLDRLAILLNPPATPAGGGGFGGGQSPPTALVAAPNLGRSDIVALARAQVRQIREESDRAASATNDIVLRAHWQDISDRATGILEPHGN